jgi:hypothetical protein
MRKLVMTAAVVALAGISSGYAKGGTHGSSGALTAPANPSVPPSLTPNPDLTGSAPLPAHHQPTRADVAALKGASLAPNKEESKVDRAVKSICRGC